MGGVSGDFGRLTATIAALSKLAAVPSRVAVIAAPRLAEQAQSDAHAERDPYARHFAPHKPATVKRWGPHPILNLNGDGIGSITGRPMGGAGIRLETDEHMRFAQGGTESEAVRAIFPNTPTMPASWNRILQAATKQAATETMQGAA